jgi:baculoviral IAP repeat-containing protein 7/8
MDLRTATYRPTLPATPEETPELRQPTTPETRQHQPAWWTRQPPPTPTTTTANADNGDDRSADSISTTDAPEGRPPPTPEQQGLVAVGHDKLRHIPVGAMASEAMRLATFFCWPWTTPSPQLLARYGLYYLGRSDLVRCHFCQTEIHQWTPHDDVYAEHLRLSRGGCRLLWDSASDNIPLQASFRMPSLLAILRRFGSVYGDSKGRLGDHSEGCEGCGYDVCGTGKLPTSTELLAEPDLRSRIASLNTMYPEYRLESDRVASFTKYPGRQWCLPIDPELMADAGFFYTGENCTVRCYICGLTRSLWSEQDNPWVVHARVNPTCATIIIRKGSDYARAWIERSVDAKLPIPKLPEDASLRSALLAALSGESVQRCVVCDGNMRDVQLLPCFHTSMCGRCSLSAESCPMCSLKAAAITRWI